MTQPSLPLKPLPKPNPTTQPFWDAAKQHRLLLPRSASGEFFFYPRPVDPHTWREGVEWAEASGKGTIYSFTIDRRGSAPAFAADSPYVIAIVQLDEGPRMTSNIVDCPVDSVRVGMRVEAVFDDVNDEITLIKFRPVIGG
jgi:hypothetical protein